MMITRYTLVNDNGGEKRKDLKKLQMNDPYRATSRYRKVNNSAHGAVFGRLTQEVFV